MNILPFLLQILALICLAFAAFGLFPSKIPWGWAGMFLWLISLMTSAITLHPVS
jgi:hypothetical protein